LLPILAKRRPQADSIIMKDRTPDYEETPMLETFALEMLRAIEAKDPKALADSLQAIHNLCESDEQEPEEDHSFAAQNRLAAQDQE
jgi:hypothetical protein